MDYLEKKSLTTDKDDAKRILAQVQKNFYIVDGILYYKNSDCNRRRLVVPTSLRNAVSIENHEAVFVGQFASM